MGKHPAWLGKAMQTGGRVHKQDGGAAGPSQEDRDVELGKSLAKTVGGGAGASISLGTLQGLKDAAKKVKGYRGPGPIGKAIGAAGALLGAGTAAAGIQGVARDFDRKDADYQRERDTNRAEPRKRGGSVKAKTSKS